MQPFAYAISLYPVFTVDLGGLMKFISCQLSFWDIWNYL